MCQSIRRSTAPLCKTGFPLLAVRPVANRLVAGLAQIGLGKVAKHVCLGLELNLQNYGGFRALWRAEILGSSPVHRDAADDAPATLSDRGGPHRAVTAARRERPRGGVVSHGRDGHHCHRDAVDALDTDSRREADDAWADWRGCICGGGAYGEMVACETLIGHFSYPVFLLPA